MSGIHQRAVAKRDLLLKESEACKRQMASLQIRIREIESQVRLLDELIGVDDDAAESQADEAEVDFQDGPRPVTAILEMVNSSPGGVTSTDVANTLADKIATKSDNPRNIIHNTLHSLWKRGKVRKDEVTGLFYPKMKSVLDDLDI